MDIKTITGATKGLSMPSSKGLNLKTIKHWLGIIWLYFNSEMTISRVILSLLTILLFLFIIYLGWAELAFRSMKEANISSTISDLRIIYSDWVHKGRPSRYDPGKEGFRGTEKYIMYTNIIVVDGHTYHCCFAVRSMDLPVGILALSDEGQILFIGDNGQKTTRGGPQKLDPRLI